jgi:hypothetical protein
MAAEPMWRFSSNRIQRNLLTGLLLVTLGFRALIPAGFMPSGHGPFSMRLCHAGMPAPAGLPEHPERSSHFDHCPFGTAPTSGPASSLVAFHPTLVGAVRLDCRFVSLRAAHRLERAHAARAPPLAA